MYFALRRERWTWLACMWADNTYLTREENGGTYSSSLKWAEIYQQLVTDLSTYSSFSAHFFCNYVNTQKLSSQFSSNLTETCYMGQWRAKGIQKAFYKIRWMMASQLKKHYLSHLLRAATWRFLFFYITHGALLLMLTSSTVSGYCKGSAASQGVSRPSFACHRKIIYCPWWISEPSEQISSVKVFITG